MADQTHEFELRRVPPGTVVEYADGEGNIRTLRAETLEGDESYAFVRPTTQLDAEVLEGFGYHVARKAEAAERTETDDGAAPSGDDTAGDGQEG